MEKRPGNAGPEPPGAAVLGGNRHRCTGASAGAGPVLLGVVGSGLTGAVEFLVVAVVTETPPVHLPINTVPISVYITHSASSLAH